MRYVMTIVLTALCVSAVVLTNAAADGCLMDRRGS